MGFSPSEFEENEYCETLHWEGKGNGTIILWDKHERRVILSLTEKEARKCSNQLALLVEMVGNDAL